MRIPKFNLIHMKIAFFWCVSSTQINFTIRIQMTHEKVK